MNVFVLNTKEDILKNVGNTVLFILLWKSMVLQNSPITNFLQNIFLCVQNKHIHTGLDLLEDECMMAGFAFLSVLSL